MADYIDRIAIRDALYDADAITMRGVAMLNKFPAADVVEVVRCRDCKWYQKGECRETGGLMDVKPDDFCSYGERRCEDD